MQLENDLRQRKESAAGAPVQIVTGVTIRVINITRKAVDVKQKYLQANSSHRYPAHFPYKQKVILLFQRIEGVDVLLFIVYVQVCCHAFCQSGSVPSWGDVRQMCYFGQCARELLSALQEYGEDAPAPNKNTVYLSYLDSVRYFQPEGKDSGGVQALRTHVYHEVLLAYMQQAVKLGMNAMYIWSCPPVAVSPLHPYALQCMPHLKPRSVDHNSVDLALLGIRQIAVSGILFLSRQNCAFKAVIQSWLFVGHLPPHGDDPPALELSLRRRAG